MPTRVCSLSAPPLVTLSAKNFGALGVGRAVGVQQRKEARVALERERLERGIGVREGGDDGGQQLRREGRMIWPASEMNSSIQPSACFCVSFSEEEACLTRMSLIAMEGYSWRLNHSRYLQEVGHLHLGRLYHHCVLRNSLHQRRR